MSVKIKETKGSKENDTIINFNNDEDYVVVTLKEDGKNYVEHKHFAKKLVDSKLAEYAKGVQLDKTKSPTTILED
ncbi:hypothetical protein CMU45_02650 [Elizabethkingia anophelis]|uniref:hypothetical protein n=1 Tax=Elizabethkingia meningoseptica TaxID=238 RepID=UPI001365479F|nr:hypothetical protein [Elizabethkingia meningoseptica]MDV3685278.1 hypothetical protein [Elizabethkingia anophelis]MVW93649.1 hypothetical protein [Elizabethkingia meningoseptica]